MKVLTKVAFFALVVEILNFALVGVPIEVPPAEGASWLDKAIQFQWVYLHWLGFRLNSAIQATGASWFDERASRCVLFLSGFVETGLIIGLIYFLATWFLFVPSSGTGE